MLDAKSIAGKTSIAGESILARNGGIFETNSRIKVRHSLLRPCLDAAVTFAVLCLICLSLGTAPSSASPNINGFSLLQLSAPPAAMKAVDASERQATVIEIATTSSPANAVYRRTSVQAAWGLLLIGLSVAAALNMALLRHLRLAYADPRRRGKAPESQIGSQIGSQTESQEDQKQAQNIVG